MYVCTPYKVSFAGGPQWPSCGLYGPSPFVLFHPSGPILPSDSAIFSAALAWIPQSPSCSPSAFTILYKFDRRPGDSQCSDRCTPLISHPLRQFLLTLPQQTSQCAVQARPREAGAQGRRKPQDGPLSAIRKPAPVMMRAGTPPADSRCRPAAPSCARTPSATSTRFANRWPSAS